MVVLCRITFRVINGALYRRNATMRPLTEMGQIKRHDLNKEIMGLEKYPVQIQGR